MVVSSQKRILFRCDGGVVPEIGSGHVSRCIALATALVETGFCQQQEIIFLTQSSPEYQLGRTLLERSLFSSISTLPQNTVNNTVDEFEAIVSFRPDLVILDRLATEAMLVTGLQQAGMKVMTFDDRGSGRAVADLAVNAIFDDVADTDNGFKGYDFLVLPPSLQTKRRADDRDGNQTSSSVNTKQINCNVNQICFSVGGYDYRNLTQFFLDSLHDLGMLDCNITIIVGEIAVDRFHAVVHAVKQLPTHLRDTIQVFHRPKTFYELITQADLIITAGGLFVFECLMRGVPSIGLPQYPHQLDTLQKLADLKSIELGSVGMSLQHDYFCGTLEAVCRSQNTRQRLSTNGQTLIDGQGLFRIVEKIQNLLQ